MMGVFFGGGDLDAGLLASCLGSFGTGVGSGFTIVSGAGAAFLSDLFFRLGFSFFSSFFSSFCSFSPFFS